MADQRLPTACRLKRGADFERVFKQRRTASDELLVVHGRANELSFARFGLSVSRKVGSAVERNRWKRLLRDAFRLTRSELPPGVDLVLIPRTGIKPTLAGLKASLPRLAARVARQLAKAGR
jgi:ribonuclease P protein component